MGSDKRVGITLEYRAKGAKDTEAATRGVTNAVEDLTAKLKKADFTPFDSLAKKLQRAEFGGGTSGRGMAAVRNEMALTAREATQLSYQLNDIFVSLAGGQKPLMVLIQQGSQITGLFGGIGATFMRLTPLVLQWAPALAAAAASAGALYAVLKAPSIGNEAAKKIADIGDAADRAKVSSDRLQAVMKAVVEAGGTPAAEVKDAAENAINRLRETLLAARKAQIDATKGKPSFAKRMSVPGPGEDPFEKANGSQKDKFYKTVRPSYQDKSPQPVKGEPSLGRVEIDKPEIQRPGAKKSPQEGPAPDLTKIGTPFPGLDDVASKLKVDVRDLDGTLPSLIKFLERISKAFAQVKDEAQKLELSIDLDKALTVPISKLVQSGNLDALRKAFSGVVDETEKFSKPQVEQSTRIRNQDELNQYTDLVISGIGLPAYAVRGVRQTITPIEQASRLERTVNGALVNLGDPAFRKGARAGGSDVSECDIHRHPYRDNQALQVSATGNQEYADTATTLNKLADVATGSALISGGVGIAPSWGKIGLATHVSGTLGVGNGGTGLSSTPTNGQILIGNGSGFALAALTQGSGVTITNGAGTISIANSAPMVYPGAGIPNSTGSAWGTSYSTSGSGTVVALATGAALTTPSLSAPTYSTNAAVTAGTNAQGQGALTSDVNVITVTGSNPSGVTLPTATTGREVWIVNRGTNPINVYPATGGTIDALAANASIQIPVGGVMWFVASSVTQWHSSYNQSVTGTGVSSISFGSTGLTPNTGTGGAVTVAGTLVVGNGGTGVTSFTSNGIVYGAGSSALQVTAAGAWDGTTGIGQLLSVNSSGVPTWTNTIDCGVF